MRHQLMIMLTCVCITFAVVTPIQAITPLTKVERNSIVPDGNVTDWPGELFSYFEPADSGNRWAVTYDDNFLHLAVVVHDDTCEFSDTSSRNSLKNDAIQLYLHTDQARLGYVITRWEQTLQTVVLPLYPDSVNPRWVVSQLEPTSLGYILELSIARKALFLADGQSNSFSLQIVILDLADGLIQRVFSLNDSLTRWQESENFLQFAI